MQKTMNTQTETQKKTSRRREILKDKELRHEFLAEQIKTGLRFQLRSLRDDQGLTQGKLAELTGTQQSVISRLERNPERVSLPTLIDIANALDVGVVVRFEQIDSIIDWYDNPTVTKMTPLSSEKVLNSEQPPEDRKAEVNFYPNSVTLKTDDAFEFAKHENPSAYREVKPWHEPVIQLQNVDVPENYKAVTKDRNFGEHLYGQN